MHLMETKPTLLGRITLYFGSVAFTGGLFIALPFTQLISQHREERESQTSSRIVMTPPPSPPEIEPPKEEETTDEDIEMNKEMQKISLDQIQMALNPGTGSMGGISTMNLASFELSDNLADDLVFEVADLDEAPEPIVRIAPAYPAGLKRKGLQGRVWILFIISENGIPSRARVVESPHPEFSSSALKAIQQWKFKPGKKNGKSVKTRVKMPLAFSLK